jgi:hypothetical protein
MGRKEKFFHLNALVEPNNHWLTKASLRMKTLLESNETKGSSMSQGRDLLR